MMFTALGIPRRSPIQVLIEPDIAELGGPDENRCFQRGIVVDDNRRKITNVHDKVVNNHYGKIIQGFSLKTFSKYII